MLEEKILWQPHKIKELNISITEFKEKYPENYTVLGNYLLLASYIADSLKHESYILVLVNGSNKYLVGFHIMESLCGLYSELYEDAFMYINNPDNYILYSIQAYFIYLDLWAKLHDQMNILQKLYTVDGLHRVSEQELEAYYNLLQKFFENIQSYAYLKAYGHLPTTTTTSTVTTLKP
ncbi:MAG: hypothetical protein DRN30_06330 [Thermoplasmata archaeon]|nr:MAG: hypothetical protein DRN30_06330 [Thermoplasmata archaeon]